MRAASNSIGSAIASLPLIVLLLPSLSGCEALEQIIRSISDGAPCSTDSECLGGTCLTEYPGGYCTTLQCDSVGCTNIFGAECLIFNDRSGEPICYASCDLDADCRDGYRCVDVDSARVCLPDTIAQDMPLAGETGTSCNRDSDCLGGTCMQNFTGGYCTRLNCATDEDCVGLGDGRCLRLEPDSEVTACFDGCSGDRECRFGYGCFDPDSAGGVCDIADDANPVRNPNGADDGAPCLVGINCKGGTCLREEEGYPGGYCTTLHCSQVGCNGEQTICRSLENDTACFVTCVDDGDCRAEYECVSGGYCSRPVNTVLPPETPAAIDLICDSEAIAGGRRLSFSIDAGTASFAVVPLSETDSLRPTRLLLPNGTTGADFNRDYAFFDLNWQILVNITPTFFPAAPQFATITEQGGGMYSLDVQTADPSPCFYVLQKSSTGSRISLNLYFVGVPDVTAQTAQSDGDVMQMLDAFERIYNSAGIALETVRYFDVSDDDRDRFRIIRDLNEVFELLSRSRAPGPTLDDQLSVNVFLIQDFAVPEAPGLLGLSSGLPGVPGLHGNHGAGLVFTTTPLGVDNNMLGQTMAHEVGHYNGLRHTTEHDRTSDPIADTPSCIDPNLGAACPDATNLMFPFSLGGISQTVVTSGQSQVLRWAPLVR